jgi:hypothetical protein
MDNSEFLDFFWGLSDNNANEKILHSAESIVNMIEMKQKFEKKTDFDKGKYKFYLKISENPGEDLLYTIKRLVFSYFYNF